MMTFDEWCTVEMMPVEERQAFKAWLGNTAKVRMSHAEWWKLFSKWVRSKSD